MGTRTCGGGVRILGAPDEEDHVKGQACFVCKWNSLRLEGHLGKTPCCVLNCIQRAVCHI
jgi:hypothetical protein